MLFHIISILWNKVRFLRNHTTLRQSTKTKVYHCVNCERKKIDSKRRRRTPLTKIKKIIAEPLTGV